MTFMKALDNGLHWLSARTKTIIRGNIAARAAKPRCDEPTGSNTVRQLPYVSVPVVKSFASRLAKNASVLFGQMNNDALDLLVRQSAALELLNLRKRAGRSWWELGLPRLTTTYIQTILVKQPATPKASDQQPATRADKARALYEAGKLDELHQFKKKVKIGWGALGFNEDEISTITQR